MSSYKGGKLRITNPSEGQKKQGMVAMLLMFGNAEHDRIFEQTGQIAGDYVMVNIMDNNDGETLRSEIVRGSVASTCLYKSVEDKILAHVMSLCERVHRE